MLPSLKSLGIPTNVVSCMEVGDAPESLRILDLTGDAKLIWVVPHKLAKHVVVNAKFKEKIRGATVYVS
jgi:hypothetical protein